jgi:WXG100 family type VII secretion target
MPIMSEARPPICGGFPVADAFSVDTAALADTVERMAQFGRAAEALLAEIDSTVKNLHISWTGEAAGAHRYAHEQWEHGAALMRAALERLGRAGAAAHHNYSQATSTNASNWA